LIFGTKFGTGFQTGSLNPILEVELKLEIFLNNVFGRKNGLELGVNQQLTIGFRLGYSEPGNIARFLYWVLECSQKYEGILKFFTFISCL